VAGLLIVRQGSCDDDDNDDDVVYLVPRFRVRSTEGETTLITCQHLLFFPYHGRFGGQLISGPMALRRLVRSEPLHPHIMGNVICAWFGKKTVGRVVPLYTKSTDDKD
jgi:hypothetical protein